MPRMGDYLNPGPTQSANRVAGPQPVRAGGFHNIGAGSSSPNRLNGMGSAVRNPRVQGLRAGVGALNAGDLPLVLGLNDTSIRVTRIQFNYEGAATNLQVGIGFKLGNVDFNSGANLVTSPRDCWGFSPLISVPLSTSLQSRTWTGNITVPVPATGSNTRRSGSSYNLSGGARVDAWVWIYDANAMGQNSFGPDTNFLAIDTDADVIQLPTTVPSQRVTNLEVLYAR